MQILEEIPFAKMTDCLFLFAAFIIHIWSFPPKRDDRLSGMGCRGHGLDTLPSPTHSFCYRNSATAFQSLIIFTFTIGAPIQIFPFRRRWKMGIGGNGRMEELNSHFQCEFAIPNDHAILVGFGLEGSEGAPPIIFVRENVLKKNKNGRIKSQIKLYNWPK